MTIKRRFKGSSLPDQRQTVARLGHCPRPLREARRAEGISAEAVWAALEQDARIDRIPRFGILGLVA